MYADPRFWVLKAAPASKPTKVLTTSGTPWIPKRPERYNRQARKGSTNYKLVLQFYFQRPINLKLWRRIKAPQGWRKCPTSSRGQQKYYGVRFMCKDLKYVLTPDEIEILRAKLYISLETVF